MKAHQHPSTLGPVVRLIVDTGYLSVRRQVLHNHWCKYAHSPAAGHPLLICCATKRLSAQTGCRFEAKWASLLVFFSSHQSHGALTCFTRPGCGRCTDHSKRSLWSFRRKLVKGCSVVARHAAVSAQGHAQPRINIMDQRYSQRRRQSAGWGGPVLELRCSPGSNDSLCDAEGLRGCSTVSDRPRILPPRWHSGAKGTNTASTQQAADVFPPRVCFFLLFPRRKHEGIIQPYMT